MHNVTDDDDRRTQHYSISATVSTVGYKLLMHKISIKSHIMFVWVVDRPMFRRWTVAYDGWKKRMTWSQTLREVSNFGNKFGTSLLLTCVNRKEYVSIPARREA